MHGCDAAEDVSCSNPCCGVDHKRHNKANRKEYYFYLIHFLAHTQSPCCKIQKCPHQAHLDPLRGS